MLPAAALIAYGLLAAIVAASTRPAAAVGVALIAWMFDNGFIVGRHADLGWHGSADVRRLAILLAVAAAAAMLGSRLRAPHQARFPPPPPGPDTAVGDDQEIPGVPPVRAACAAEAAQLASLADETPEGRSIVVLAKERFNLRERELGEHEFVPFTAATRMSGVNTDGSMVRKGAADAVRKFVDENGGRVPAEVDLAVRNISEQGGTPLVVAKDNWALGVIYLKDIVKGGMRERFDELRRMGIQTVMITGDNQITAGVIAKEPAMFAFTYAARPGQRGPLNALNIMHLGDPKSAIVSAIIFNALIIPALVPLALRGVKYRAIGATALLRRNLLIYGLGGLILPFIGIKLIDLIVHNLLGA